MEYTINKKAYLNVSVYIFSGLLFFFLFLSMFIVKNNTVNELIFLTLLAVAFLAFSGVMKIGRNIKVLSYSFFLLKLGFLFIYSIGNDIVIFPDSYDYILHLDRLIVSGDYSIQNIQIIASTLHVGHYYFMLIPYLLFGAPESILYFNALLISVSTILLYKVFELEFGKKVALFTFVFSLVSLNLAVFGSFILKDASVVFSGSLIIYFVRIKNRPYMAILLSLLLFTIRIYAGFAFLAAILFELIFIKKTSNLFRFMSVLVIGVFFLAILTIPAVSIYFDKSLIYTKEMANFSLLTSTLASLVKFYFAPLPWNVISNYDVYSVLLFDSVVFLLLSFSLFLFVIKFLKDKYLRAKMWLFIIPILVHAAVLGHEYGGDSTRQRIGVFIFLILTLGIGLFYKKETRAD